MTTVALVASLSGAEQVQAGLARITTGLQKVGNDATMVTEKATRGFKSFGLSMGGVQESLGAVSRALGALGLSVGISSIIRIGTESLKAAGAIGETAQQLGLSTKSLQAYTYAATQVGVRQEELEAAFRKLTQTIGEAATGNKGAIDTFNKLGVGILDAGGHIRSTEAIALDMADALAKIPDPATRAALEVELLGRSGQKLDTLFAGGSASIRAFTEEAQRLGLVLDEAAIKKADDAADKMEKLSFVFDKFSQSLAVRAAPALSDFLDKIDQLITKGPSFADVMDSLSFSPLGSLLSGKNFSFSDLFQSPPKPNATTTQDFGDPRRRPSDIITTNPVDDQTAAATSKALQDQASKTQAVVDAIEAEHNALFLTSAQMKTYVALKQAGIDANSALGRSIAAQIEATEHERAEHAQIAKEIEAEAAAHDKLRASAAQLYASTRTPQENYNTQVKEYQAMVQGGSIDLDTYNRAVAALNETLSSATPATNQWEASLQSVGNTASDVFSQIADQLATNLATGGNLFTGFASIAVSALNEVLKGLFNVSMAAAGLGGGGGKSGFEWQGFGAMFSAFGQGLLGGLASNLGGSLSGIFSGLFGGAGSYNASGVYMGRGGASSAFPFQSGTTRTFTRPTLISVAETEPERVSVVRGAGTGGPGGNGGLGGPGQRPLFYLDLRGSNGEASIQEAVARGIKAATPAITELAVNKVQSRNRREPDFLHGGL